MRLRGVLERQTQKRLVEVLKGLEKINRHCTVLLSPETVVFVVNPGAFNDAQAWATLQAESPDGTGVFQQFRIESQQDNKIGFEVDLRMLQVALKSAEPGEMTTVKLKKKNHAPVLSFEILTQSIPIITVNQDVPVRLLSAIQVNALNEPHMDHPTVRLISPSIKILSSVVERLKGLHDRIRIKANMNGELEVGASSDMAFMTNNWRDLSSPNIDGEPPQPRDPSKRAEAVVDANLLSKVFAAHSLRPSQAICCMMDRNGLKLVVWLLFMGANDCVTYFVPVIEA